MRSAAAHVSGREDALIAAGGLPAAEVRDWRLLSQEGNEEAVAAFRSHLRTGRPLGDEGFVAGLENRLGRTLHRRKPGPPAGHKRKRR